MTAQEAPSPGEYGWTFGDRLRKIRRVHGLGQVEFASALSVNAKSVAAWEADSWLPRGIVALAKRINLVYGVPVEWTLGLDEGSEKPPTGPNGGGLEKLPRLDSNQEPTD